MVAVIWSFAGTIVLVAVIVGLVLTLRPREAVHRFVSDQDFGPWHDVWRLAGRRFGDVQLGTVVQCFRALVVGVPVELVEERPPGGREGGGRWSVVARAPREYAFTVTRTGAGGAVPAGCDDLVATARGKGIAAVLCGDGLLVVRATSPQHLTHALRLLVAWVGRLRP